MFDLQLLLEEKLNTGSLSQEVGVFLELVWTEALSRLGDILPSIDKISLNDVRLHLSCNLVYSVPTM